MKQKKTRNQSRLTIVYTTGVFDMFHMGHLNILKRASRLGDRLIVGIQDDESVFTHKGERPVFPYSERAAIVEALAFVDAVIPYTDTDQRPLLDLIKPDIVVQGEDWLESGNRTKAIEYLKKNHIRLVRFPYTRGISSSSIKVKTHPEGF